MQAKWTGITSNTSLSAANRKTLSGTNNTLGKRCQVTGPASGTWTAIVKFYRSEDGLNDVLAATSVTISNTTPSDITELLSTATMWNYSVESVTGTIPTTPYGDGSLSGLTITVGG